MEMGTLNIRAPEEPAARAASSGLVGGRPLLPRQSRRVDLAYLAGRVRIRGALLTPGAVAAHGVGRRLAVRAARAAQRASSEASIRELLFTAHDLTFGPGAPDSEHLWATLRRSGWVGRLVGLPDGLSLVRSAIAAVASIPSDSSSTDRRRLAADTTGDPHSLDDGTVLSGLVLALLVAAGRVRPRQRPRDAWLEARVACDDVTGGLLAVGLLPHGWFLPPGAIVTLPPRVLSDCAWTSPSAGESWAFVTENPSVAAAAADLARDGHPVRLLCTSGTPSTLEVAAIARLEAAGWRVAVRADFDEAGLTHVATILDAVPHSAPWRMGSSDYVACLSPARDERRHPTLRVPATPWDPSLHDAMQKAKTPAYEESLMPLLLEDLRRGEPQPPPA